jgi:hypothetical protein
VTETEKQACGGFGASPGRRNRFFAAGSPKFSVLFPFFPCRMEKRDYIILFKMEKQDSARKMGGFPALKTECRLPRNYATTQEKCFT